MPKRKQNRLRHYATGMGAIMLSFLIFSVSPVTAEANYNKEEAGEVAYEPDINADDSTTGVVAEDTGGKPFSIEGNGELIDDAADDDTKEFLTVQTKNNQTFFVVIDRSSGLALPETEEKSFEELQAEEEAEKALEAEKQKAEAKKGTVMFVIVLLIAAGLFCGGYYYFKFYKPRKEEENAESEDLEDGRWNDAEDYDYEDVTEPDDVFEDGTDSIEISGDADNNEEIDQEEDIQ